MAGCKIDIDVHVFCSIHLREILQEVFMNLYHYIFSDISLLKSLPQLQELMILYRRVFCRSCLNYRGLYIHTYSLSYCLQFWFHVTLLACHFIEAMPFYNKINVDSYIVKCKSNDCVNSTQSTLVEIQTYFTILMKCGIIDYYGVKVLNHL